MLGFIVGGLFVFCIFTYLVLMLLFPEWVGISKNKDVQSDLHKPNSSEKITASEENVSTENNKPH
jgi:hypothetical protein